MNRPAQPPGVPSVKPSDGSATTVEPAAEAETDQKQIYLRTLYPLNPGIPHYVDNPAGW